MHEYWARETTLDLENGGDPVEEQLRVDKMKALKVLCDAKFTKMVNLTLGVGNGTIETGEVAHVLIGKLPSGKLLVIYGIDVWT